MFQKRFLSLTLGVAIGFIAFVGISTPVSAATISPNRCDLATTRIDLLTTRYLNNKDRHVERYTSAKNKVSTLVSKLDGKGYDVTKLKADLQTWDTMIKKIGTDYNSFIDSLNLTKQYVCGQSQGDFRAQLKDAQSKLAVVKQSSLDARLYYQQTIRADIQALRAQK